MFYICIISVTIYIGVLNSIFNLQLFESTKVKPVDVEVGL